MASTSGGVGNAGAGALTAGVGSGASTGGATVGGSGGAGGAAPPDDPVGGTVGGGAAPADGTVGGGTVGGPNGCNCTENQVCDPQTQTCIPDPCGGVTCGGKGTCSITDNGGARCDCEGEWSGLECNQRWYTIDVPPFVEDVAFDGDGNGWFATTQGLLFWDFNDTPGDTADDSWQLFGEFYGSSADLQSIVIDSLGVKWVLAGRLHRHDDNDTPSNTADDTWENYELTHWREPATRRIVLDREDRLWWLGQTGTGVKVLPATELHAGPADVGDPMWVSLFTEEVVRDVAVGSEGIWVAAESGLYYVSLGETLADETDDVWTDFSEVPELGGHAVSSIELDRANGSVWFNSAGGVVHLIYAGDPLSEATNTWTRWSPQVDEAPVEIGPVIGVGADAAVWLRSPQGAAVRVAPVEPGNDELTLHHPSSCPEYAETDSAREVDSLTIDDRGDQWLSWGGALLHFDDGGTATDTSDDRWTRLGRAALSESVLELFPAVEGGVWLKSHRGHGASTPGCSGDQTLYYVDVGAFTNGLDDAWMQHPLNEELSSCFEVLGPDNAGHLWIKDQPPQRSDGPWHLLDVGTTPANPSDDTWTAWTDADASPFSASVAVVDPVRGLWIGDQLFSYGASLSDASDDSWWTLGARSPSSVALDARGGRWFGYDAAVLRYFDDGGTVDLATDDRWEEYASVDGLPVESIRDLQIDALNGVWILGNRFDDEPQLCRLDPSATPSDTSDHRWTCYTTHDGLANSWVSTMAVTPAGNVWVGTYGGLQYLELDR